MTLKTISADHAASYLSRNAWRYTEALSLLESKLHTYASSQRGRKQVYRIYSRADRQRGRESLKELWQIKEVVNRNYLDGNDSYFQDVHDIIAVTVVCLHAPDVEAVRAFIESQLDFGRCTWTRKDDPEGHKGLHGHIAFAAPLFAGVQAELQIKTIVEEAWDAWTHDLTYKPAGGSVTPLFKRQFSLLSTQLDALGSMARSVRDEIEEQWKDERKLKLEARRKLLEIITNAPLADRGSDLERQYVRLRNRIDKAKKSELTALHNKVHEFGKRNEHNCDTARLHTRISLRLWKGDRLVEHGDRPEDEAIYIALDALERWVQLANSPYERERALTFMAMVYFCFDQNRRSIDVAERALAAAANAISRRTLSRIEVSDAKLKHRYFVCLGNLAYYVASSATTTTRARAIALVKRMRSEADNMRYRVTPSQLDTIGFVMVACATSSEDAKEGLKDVERAHSRGQQRALGRESEATEEEFHAFHRSFAEGRIHLLERSESGAHP
ncbi:MAG TPA: hypothetical protein VGB83_10535 [Actinomycetota bacterium]